jgi:hypothetical protein
MGLSMVEWWEDSRLPTKRLVKGEIITRCVGKIKTEAPLGHIRMRRLSRGTPFALQIPETQNTASEKTKSVGAENAFSSRIRLIMIRDRNGKDI